MRPSTRCLSELELRFSGNDQEILCALGNICQSETPDKDSFSRVAEFYKIDGEILEAEQKMYASFHRVRGLGYMTVSEILETVYENDLFDMFPEFSNVAHILSVIPATSCSAERSFSALRRLKTYLRSTMGQQRVSNITLINSVVNNDMDRIIDTFGRRNGRDIYVICRLGGPYSETLWPRSWKFCPRPQAEGSIFKAEVTVFHCTDRP